MSVDDLEGKSVKGQVLRWEDSQAGDLSAPLYADVGEGGYVTGTLAIVKVKAFGGYTAYSVGGYDVDPDTVEEVQEDDGGEDA
jgi:hypothetical protein